MAYPKHIYDKAHQILAARLQNARELGSIRKQKVYHTFPKIAQIDRDLANTGYGVVKAVLGTPNDLDAELNRLKETSLSLQKEREDILAKGGYPADYLEIPYHCPKCQDSGYLGSELCACLRQLLKEQAYAALGGLSTLHDYSFDNFLLKFYTNTPDPDTNINIQSHMAELKSFCTQYAMTFSPSSESLLFMGSTGLGKTHLSLAIASTVVEREFGVVYTSAQNLLYKLDKEKFAKEAVEEEHSYLSLVQSCDLLILDDLGTEHLTQYSASMLYNIINTRLIEHRPTIINTNLDITTLQNKYADRIVSRLIGGFRTFRFYGKDIRIAKRFS